MLEFAGAASPLGPDDIARVAAQLGVEPATISAVDEVESRGHGFLADGRPTILFERHIFSRRTGHRYDDSHPGISNASAGGYGASGAHQFDRLLEAIALDRKAALESASWGRYQVMGFNAGICGWGDVEAFVASMRDSEAEHLKAFVGYCRANNLVRFLATHDWRSFSRGYNGTGNVEEYSAKLAAAYQKHKSDPAVSVKPAPPGPAAPASTVNPVDLIRQAQQIIGAAADGDPGDETRRKLREWSGAHPGA